jgi:putative restriction endonuclease
MAKAILNWGPTSHYDDKLPDKYHFIERHRSQIRKCVGDDVIIYSAAHAGGCQGYVATATVVKIKADNEKGPGNYYAVLANFRPFARFVPHIVDGTYVEESAVSKSGRFAPLRSVRFPSNDDFARIIALSS